MKRFLNFMPALFMAIVVLSACEKDDPHIPHEEELITTLKYTLSPVGGGDDVVMMFRDLDGDGGDEPEITGGLLKSNTIYNGSLELLNELETPAHDISHEIEEEADEHQFFFSTNIADLQIAYDDKDSNGNPLGLKTIATTGDIEPGQLTIILRHGPAKDAEGVSDGNIANAGGETDIEVTFDIDVQ